jgi:hypothetical protein
MEIESPKELPYVDRIDLAEVFADQIRLIHFDGHSVRIEFAVARPRTVGPNQAESTDHPRRAAGDSSNTASTRM